MNEPRVVTDSEAFLETARDADELVPTVASSGERGAPTIRIPVEVRVTVDDPFLAYRRARGAVGAGGEDESETRDTSREDETEPTGTTGGVFLETTGGQSGWGYFGVDPVDGLTVGSDAVGIGSKADQPDRPQGSTSHLTAPTLAALEGLLDSSTLLRGGCDVPYPGGAIGWLSYDVARELEDLPGSAVDDRGLPRLEVGVYDRLAAWECPLEDDEPATLRVTACPELERTVLTDPAAPEAVEALESAYQRGLDRALELAEATVAGDPTVGSPPVTAPEATFESACGREAFADRVRAVKGYVRDGDTFQVNISQRLVAPAAVHPVDAFDALRRVNPAPYSCLLEFRSADLVSASPELLLERRGSFVRTEPIAGTRPRGETTAADERLEAELLGDEKERAEHAMLVDLERNDLGKVCAYGSVDVEEYRRVDRYSEVMHLVSNVVGSLSADAALADAIAATFPGGTITGAPKPRTMEIIDELEATRRGPYTGSIGIFGFDDRATLNIIIRTLVRDDDEYHLRVGAGIVHDSEPRREYDETLDKARALLTAIDTALGERVEMGLESDAAALDSSDGGDADTGERDGGNDVTGGPDETDAVTGEINE